MGRCTLEAEEFRVAKILAWLAEGIADHAVVGLVRKEWHLSAKTAPRWLGRAYKKLRESLPALEDLRASGIERARDIAQRARAAGKNREEIQALSLEMRLAGVDEAPARPPQEIVLRVDMGAADGKPNADS